MTDDQYPVTAFDQHGHSLFYDKQPILALQVKDRVLVYGGYSRCKNCGEFLNWDTVNNSSEFAFKATTECTLKSDGVYSVRLPVPSGKIVVTDDLRGVYGEPDETVDYSSILGKLQYAEGFERMGVAYGAVMNTSPSVFLAPDADSAAGVKLVIADLGWAESDEYGDHDENMGNPAPEGWAKVGEVCTDLWAYSIADHDHYTARMAQNLKNGVTDLGRDVDVEVIEIPAGVWEFTHFADQLGFEHHDSKLTVFAEAKLVQAL